MQISRLKISNFRSIKEAEIQFGAVTVLIGTNNAGKSAILEAIRIALTRRWGQRGTGFTEYDVHLCDGRPDPKVGDPVVIEVELQEAVANDSLLQKHGVSVSFGMAMLHAQDDETTLFDRADKALYQAKKSGRNCAKWAA
ncbi:AAA family ATPase [Phaeobacter italicus]|uniref:AAA family ATPase n=1 Tax=Phaeobacter italicus TaxID=481446 RepID=UPI00248D3B4A|nr:AAA family ATPase [Phaeobacter italicus]